MLILPRKLYARIFTFAGFFFCVHSFALSALERTVFVASLQGGSFMLIKNDGQRTARAASDIPKSGIVLQNSDAIQTSSGVFVEVQMKPGNTVISIAENSSLYFDTVDGASGSFVISLVYGRVRVKHQNKKETVVVRAGPSITEIQSGAINIDYMLVPDIPDKSQPILSVSTISGTAVVIPASTSPSQGRIKMKRSETLIFDAQNGRIERRPMDNEIPEYWDIRTKRETVKIPAQANTDLITQSQVLVINTQLTPSEQAAFLKTGGIITGLVVMLIGVAVQNVVHYTYDDWSDSEKADLTFYAGYVPIGMGAFVLLASYFYPSSK
jgi:hypothetical protein